jgi:hypothetical protein
MPVLGTNNPVYLFFSKDSDVSRMAESEFNLPIFFQLRISPMNFSKAKSLAPM